MTSKRVHPKLHFLCCHALCYITRLLIRNCIVCDVKKLSILHTVIRGLSYVVCFQLFMILVACEVTFKSCFYVSYILIKLATKMYDLATIFFPFVTGRLLNKHTKKSTVGHYKQTWLLTRTSVKKASTVFPNSLSVVHKTLNLVYFAAL